MADIDTLNLGGGGSVTTDELKRLLGISGGSYTIYRAVLTQSGNDAPVATVLENSLGFTPTWSRSGAGFYFCDNAQIQAAGAANKLYYSIGSSTRNVEGGLNYYIDCRWNSESSLLQLLTSDGSNYADAIISGGDGFFNLPVEILIYS